MAIFDGYRKSLGEDRAIGTAPGHLFDDSDTEQLESILGLALYFYWDALLVDLSRTACVAVNHDEMITVAAVEKERLEAVVTQIERIGVKRVTEIH